MLISPGNQKYRGRRQPASTRVLRAPAAVPGVEAAAVTDSLPPDRQGDSDTFGIGGRFSRRESSTRSCRIFTVGPDYLRVLGIHWSRGDTFNTHDSADSAPG